MPPIPMSQHVDVSDENDDDNVDELPNEIPPEILKEANLCNDSAYYTLNSSSATNDSA